MAYQHIGKDFTPPDILGKVTGQARYAEDFRADGMVFCKTWCSPLPHARVTRIDASAALEMDGVVGVLTPDDVPGPEEAGEVILTDEPSYVGEPIVAVAAISEQIATDALHRIKVDLEPLPFVTDPLDSLHPRGPNAREGGNAANRGVPLQTHKWNEQDFFSDDGGLPTSGAAVIDWSYGDLEAGFEKASIVLDETFVTASNPHHSMEPRSAMCYWENGKCFVYGSCQSQGFVIPGLASLLGVDPADVVFIAEYCGGGFGSKGGAYAIMALPAYMSKKIGRPVMHRVSREQEFYWGSARAGFQGRIRMGFGEDGRVVAADLYIVQQNGPKTGFPDYASAADAVSLVYQPEAMRFRGIPVLTNTTPAGAQRGPGQNQIAMAVEPLLDKAARALEIDRMAIRRINAPGMDASYSDEQGPITSSYLKEALDLGAREFDWEAKQALSGQRNGSKVIGIGTGQAYHSAGASGFDGLVRITPDGLVHIHSGVGNLGTYSYAGTSRVVAEVLQCDWEKCVIHRGDSREHLPWNLGQFGSNTSYTMTRSNHAAAMDLKNKMLEIASIDFGGNAEDYDVDGERVFSKADPDKSLTYAEVAQRAVEIGGKYDGHALPDDIFFLTRASATAVAGSGLVGVAKDNYEKNGTVPALAVGYMMIELDVETGEFEILEYQATADCGTVIHPQGLSNQIRGGGIMGIGLATTERVVYDPHNGLPANAGFYQAKPPSYLEAPDLTNVAAVDQPDPQNPIGAKGIGEPLMGCAAAALLCAISDAMGGHYFNRTPVVPDMIVNAMAGKPQSHGDLQVNTF
jgi:xanthine dehydrogenase molybdenum-binding subunit